MVTLFTEEVSLRMTFADVCGVCVRLWYLKIQYTFTHGAREGALETSPKQERGTVLNQDICIRYLCLTLFVCMF